jgi:uncharacterized protein
MNALEPLRSLLRKSFNPSFAALVLGGAALASAQAPFKVFMIASKASDHIAMSTRAKDAIAKLGETDGYTVDYTLDTSLINETNLAKYDVFLQMHLAPFEISVGKRPVFEKWITSGKPWVGVHAAGLTGDQFTGGPSWTFYTQFFGGITYVVHPALQDGTLLIEDKAHPAFKNLPASFTIHDEWYEWSKNPRANVHVIAKADETSYKQVKSQGDHPIIWANPEYARTMYIGVGHFAGDWDNANYVKMIREVMLWAMPATTALAPRAAEKGYISPMAGSPEGNLAEAGRGWKRVGALYVGPDAPGGRFSAGVGPMDALGRNLSVTGAGASGFRLLQAPR